MWPVVVLLTLDARIVAQEGVALEIAEAIVEALKGELATTAVNVQIVPAEVHFVLFSDGTYDIWEKKEKDLL
ncbi:hypothetical protein V6N13_090062 [Hibiscus sabdariffa]|uniref:Uncharacterized protein n=1 Tax=Hibiscus sabdariffa TaxID=183260 RepID=A0ABR2QIG1_9ROSI